MITKRWLYLQALKQWYLQTKLKDSILKKKIASYWAVSCNKNIDRLYLLDGLINCYHNSVKSKSWYHQLLWYFLEVFLFREKAFYRKVIAVANFSNSSKCQLPNHCYAKGKSWLLIYEDDQLTWVTRRKPKKYHLSQYLISQTVLVATNIAHDFENRKPVVKILDTKESRKWNPRSVIKIKFCNKFQLFQKVLRICFWSKMQLRTIKCLIVIYKFLVFIF